MLLEGEVRAPCACAGGAFAHATSAHVNVGVSVDHAGGGPGTLQLCVQSPGHVAAFAPLFFFSKNPTLHEYVPITAFDAAYEKSTLSYETIPFVSASIALHFAATHVGGVLDGSHVPAESHASDGAPTSE